MKIAVGQFEAAASSPLSMFWRHQKPPPSATVSDWENWRENIAVTHRSWPEFHPGGGAGAAVVLCARSTGSDQQCDPHWFRYDEAFLVSRDADHSLFSRMPLPLSP